MSAKNLDHHKRWRCITVGFRVSPEESYRIDMEVKTSGLAKQDFILKRLLNDEIIVRPNIRIQKYLEDYLVDLTNQLKRLERIPQDSEVLDNITYIVRLISQMSET